MSEDRNMSVKAFLTVGDGKQEVRRFGIPEAVSTNFNYVKERIRTVFGLGSKNITVSWQDSEGDQIVISSDDELLEAISDIICRKGDSLLRLHVSVEANVPDNVVHDGVICDGCDGPIIGNRYKCIRCKDYDLCEQCERKNVHPRHRKIKITSSKSPFSTVFELLKQSQSEERAKTGFENDFSEKCDVNDEFGECNKQSSGKWRGYGRRWSRGGQWANAGDGNGDLGSDHPSKPQCGCSGPSSSSFYQGFQGPHHQGPHQKPHNQGPHHSGTHHHGPHHQGSHHQGQDHPHQSNQSFPHCGAFLGGWPFVSVGVGVPPTGEHMVPPEAQRVAEEASKFASQMASKHVSDLFKGIWTAWSGNNGEFCHQDGNGESKEAPKTSKQDNATNVSEASKSTPTASSQNSGQFASGTFEKSTDRVINIEIECEKEAEKESSDMEHESAKSPTENDCTPMDMGNNLNEDDTSQTSAASVGSQRGEEWTLLNRESVNENPKESVVNTPDEVYPEEIDNDIIEIPVEVVNDGNHLYPSIPAGNETTELTPEEQRIKNALDHMKAMGYSDEGGWLTRLLQMKNGDINQVLDLLLVHHKPKN